MENPAVHDVRPEQYAPVIRELIRHENDVTNHRLMWLLIVQALLVNAYVTLYNSTYAADGIAVVGLFVTLSAFVMLYKSYQARGYLRFLGEKAKRGELQEKHLPLDGWPRRRISSWRKDAWMCPWLERLGDLVEPYLFLPVLVMSYWMFALLRTRAASAPPLVLVFAILLAVVVLVACCTVWVWTQWKCERFEEEVRP